jgi:spore coat polysaccharide biosynthesis protein SpsF
MNKPLEVLIAIQARSNSTRLPKKIYESIGDRSVLDHVIDRAKSTAAHITKYTNKLKINCTVAVLHPENDDELVKAFRGSGAILIAGSENDVLSRYIHAQSLTDADYVVRLTSDCPLILDFVIAKHIHVACFNQYDYVSNVEDSCRLIADGFDCEVISRRAMNWLSQNARSPEDREHVTQAIRKRRPPQLSQAFVSMKMDTSDMKMSVDTIEDLNRMRDYYHKRAAKVDVAKAMFGTHVYEL